MNERQTTGFDGNMAPLSRLDDYEVADDSEDVRGWQAVTIEEQPIGEVEDLIVDVSTMTARYLVVDLGDGRGARTDGAAGDAILVPTERVRLDAELHRVALDAPAAGLAALPRYDRARVASDYGAVFGQAAGEPRPSPADGADPQRQRLTRSAEELRIGKRTVPAGEVEVHKRVETERVTTPVTKVRDEVRVERRPVDDAGRPGRLEDDDIRIPVTEEEVVVEKRPVVKEEIVISKDRQTVTENVATDLQKEHIEVDRPPGRRDKKERR